MIPDEKSHGTDMQTRCHAKIKFLFSDEFGLRGPVIQKTFHTKTATAVVASVQTR